MNYHLKVLGDLVDKDEQTGYYTLSEKGRIALALLGKFQSAATKRPDGVRVVGVLLMITGLAELYVGVPNATSWLGAGSNPFFVFGLSASIASLALGISFVGSGIGLLYSRGWAWSATILSFLAGISLESARALDSVGENKPDSDYSCYFHFVRISSLRKVALETKKRSTSTTRRATAMMRRFDVEPRSTILSSPAT